MQLLGPMTYVGLMTDQEQEQRTGKVLSFTAGDRLRKARESIGLDRTQFAKLIGIHRSSVASAETGVHSPFPVTIKAWADATGASLEWLKHGESPDPPPTPLPFTPGDQEPSDYGSNHHNNPISSLMPAAA